MGKCESGIYHIVLRGINRQDIFYDEEDFKRFLEKVTQSQIARVTGINPSIVF